VSQPYIGEIRMFGGNFAPQGWAFCDGSILPISQYDTLFNLIGTTYGGDGQVNFALPDLRGRIPIHQGSGNVIGTKAGTETITLLTAQLPVHNHIARAQSAAGGQPSPGNGFWAAVTTLNVFSLTAGSAAMNASCIPATGGNQPHENRMPYLAVNFIISLFGIYPSQG
jgi:microcystin-dependent protein